MRQEARQGEHPRARPALRVTLPSLCALRRYLVLLLLAAWSVGAVPAQAQDGAPAAEGMLPTLERQLLFSIYHAEPQAFRYTMRAAHASAYPVFYAAPVAAWGAGLLSREEGGLAAAYRLTISQVATAGLVMGLKRMVGRERPFYAVPGIASRTGGCSEERKGCGTFAFPSGHSAMAFAIATSVSLSHPEWYVAAPALTWAASVALSRVWLGVHYPSDILAGAVLGASVAWGVYLLGSLITPGFLRPNESTPAVARQRAPPAVTVRIRF